MSENIEQKCLAKGVKLTDQRKIIAKVMSESNDHPDVDELYKRVSKIDSKISIATVYRTVKLFEEVGILTKHEFRGGKARYEELNEGHHDHLIDIKSGEIIEFVDDEIEKLASGVEIPDAFYKIIADDSPSFKAYIIPQDVAGSEIIEQFVVSVDSIESVTQIDFFWELDDVLEDSLERIK